MKSSNIKSVILTTIALTLICAVSSSLLALTNALTADRIANAQKEAEQKAMARVVKADEYSEATVSDSGDNEYVYYTAKNNNGMVLGYIFTTSQNGYGGEVKVMTAISPEGKILAIEVLSAGDETPGLGQNVTKKDFWKLFVGKSGKLSAAKSSASDTDIQAVTGATISSRAVVNSVNKATELFEIINKEAAEK